MQYFVMYNMYAGFLLVMFSFFVNDHAIYISVVDITYSTNGDAEMLIKVFEDDLEIALQNFMDDDSLHTPNLDDIDLIQSYFRKHVLVGVNGDSIQTNYQSQEKVNDSIWLHFSMKGPANCSSMNLKVSHFMEIYPDQSNIVTVRYKGSRKFLRCTTKEQSGSLTL